MEAKPDRFPVGFGTKAAEDDNAERFRQISMIMIEGTGGHIQLLLPVNVP